MTTYIAPTTIITRPIRLNAKVGRWGTTVATTDLVPHLVPFTTHGALHGDHVICSPEMGQLPAEWVDVLQWHIATTDTYGDVFTAYIVWSYSTPIAWWTPTYGWYVPDVRYSMTTTHHQSAVRTSLAFDDCTYTSHLDVAQVLTALYAVGVRTPEALAELLNQEA